MANLKDVYGVCAGGTTVQRGGESHRQDAVAASSAHRGQSLLFCFREAYLKIR